MLKEFHRFLYGHIQYIVNGLSFVFYFQRLPIVPFALADLARHIDIRKEMHLDLQDSIAGACLTPSAFYIKAETALLVTTRLCIRSRRKQITDLIEHTGVGRRIRTRRPSNR